MNKDKQYLSVVNGNDFTLNMHVTRWNADNQSFIDYRMDNCSQVVCFLVAVTGGRRYKLPVTISGNVLTADIDGSMLNVGVYGLELLFEDADSHSKRSYEAALLKIVRTNAEATYTQADFDSEDECRLHITVQTNASFITIGAPTADTQIDGTSSNAVSNSAVAEAISNLQTQIDNIGAEILDPSSVYTKAETEALIDTMVDPQEMADYVSNAVSNYTTTEEFENANEAISGSLNDLNTRISAIEDNPVDLTAYVSKDFLSQQSYLQASALDGLATENYVTEQIEAIPAPDMSAYVSKEYLSQQAYLQASALNGYATQVYVTEQIANIPQADMSAYVSKDYLSQQSYLQADDLGEYATKSFVSEQIEAIPDPDLSAYATKSFVSEQIANIPAPDLSAYVTETELTNTLSSYAKVSDIEDNERVVSTALNSLADRIGLVENDYVSDDDLADALAPYATEAYVVEKIDALAPSDLNEYVSKQYLSEQSYLQASALDGLATEVYVTEQIEAIPAPDMSAYVTKTEINTASYLQADDLNDYATKSYVDEKISGITPTDMSAYVTKTELNAAAYLQSDDLNGLATEVYVTEQIEAIPAPDMSAYVTKTEINTAGYLQADDLSAYASKEYLSQQAYLQASALDGLATEVYVTEQIAAIPAPDMSAYVTKTELNAAAYLQADDLSAYASKEYLSQQAYVTETALDTALSSYVTETALDTALSSYAKVSDIEDNEQVISTALNTLSDRIGLVENDYVSDDDLADYATKSYVVEKIDELSPSDLNEYVSKEYLSQQAYLQASALDGYATQVYVTEQIEAIPAPDMSAYVTKTELNTASYLQADDLSSYASKEYLSQQAYLQADDLADYVTDSDLANAGYVTNTALTNTLSSYTTKADVPYKFVVMSYSDYTALATKDPNTFYCIPEE